MREATNQHQTARQVDREHLLAKLRRHGITKDSAHALTFSEDVARGVFGVHPALTAEEVAFILHDWAVSNV